MSYENLILEHYVILKLDCIPTTNWYHQFGIEMRKLNHFINKPFANGFCVLEYSKLKMYGTYLLLF